MSGANPVKRALKQNIKDALTRIDELEATVTDFNGDQQLLQDRVLAYTASLERLHGAGEGLEVPQDAVRHLDEGGHPDVWAAETFSKTNRANQLVKGKTADLQILRDCLLEEAKALYPDEAAKYQAIVAAQPAAPQAKQEGQQ